MTLEREPVTIENALFRVLGKVGVDRAAAATNRSADYLRSLSHPDNRYRLSVEDAVLLDIEHLAVGGDGTPIYDTYTQLLGQAHAARFADKDEIARRACILIRENAEAEEAVVLASMHGATPAVRANARRQLEDVVSVARATIAGLTDPDPEAPP